jgi:hypothetical protein
MAVQWIDRARSIAMFAPPLMDMCAPRTICELRLPICNFIVPRVVPEIANRKSEI